MAITATVLDANRGTGIHLLAVTAHINATNIQDNKKEIFIMEQKETLQTKTQVFNMIILDRSGSMSSIRKAAIDGFNETLAGIKKAQEKFSDTQEHYVSLVTFCSCETRYVYDKVFVSEAHPLTEAEYEPCCCTPLYDAMGFTLSAMRKYVKNIEDCVVVVTIITDGYENASKEYTGQAIKSLIETLRGEGWTFTYMGANQNSMEVAKGMAIRNSRDFAYSEEGTRASMCKDTGTRMNFFSRLSSFKQTTKGAVMAEGERKAHYTAMADEAFDEEESKG